MKPCTSQQTWRLAQKARRRASRYGASRSARKYRRDRRAADRRRGRRACAPRIASWTPSPVKGSRKLAASPTSRKPSPSYPPRAAWAIGPTPRMPPTRSRPGELCGRRPGGWSGRLEESHPAARTVRPRLRCRSRRPRWRARPPAGPAPRSMPPRRASPPSGRARRRRGSGHEARAARPAQGTIEAQ